MLVVVQLMLVSAGVHTLWILGSGLTWRGGFRRVDVVLETASGVWDVRISSRMMGGQPRPPRSSHLMHT